MKRKDIRPSFSKIWNTESDVFYPGNKKKKWLSLMTLRYLMVPLYYESV